jgi:hypothetical protein
MSSSKSADQKGEGKETFDRRSLLLGGTTLAASAAVLAVSPLADRAEAQAQRQPQRPGQRQAGSQA